MGRYHAPPISTYLTLWELTFLYADKHLYIEQN